MSLSRFITKTYGNVVLAPEVGVVDLEGLASKKYVKDAISAAVSGVGPAPVTPTPAPSDPAELPADVTLQNLTVEQTSRFSGTVTVPDALLPEQAASKGYVDGKIGASGFSAADIAGSGLTAQDGKLAVSQPFDTLAVDGTATFRGGVIVRLPQSPLEAVNRAYADGLTNTAGTGLRLTNKEFAVADTLTHVTQVGVLDGLHVNGPAAFGMNVTVRSPVDANDAASKIYVDSQALRNGGVFQYQTVAEGDTVTVTGSRLVVDPPAPIAALTIILPDGVNGRVITLTSTQDVAAVTFQNGTLRATKLAALTAEVPASLVYAEGPAAWFAT